MPQMYPCVTRNEVDKFAGAWDSGGLKLILDDTTRRFALDFANIVLRSFVEDLAKKAMVKRQANPAAPLQANAVSNQTVPEPPKEPKIILAT